MESGLFWNGKITDPIGPIGCGFYHVVDGVIIFQRGYRDKPCVSK